MPPEIIPEDEDYASSEDSDFAPDATRAKASDDSSDEEPDDGEEDAKPAKPRSTKRKRAHDEEAEDAGFENSGDEAIIERGLKKRQKRRGKKGRDAEDVEDDGGDGGLIKTRSMRALEKVEKKPLVDISAATVDVDALWASMISGTPPELTRSPGVITTIDTQRPLIPGTGRSVISSQSDGKDPRSRSALGDSLDAMIMIKRTYNFAGKVHVEQKLVPRDSAEARLFVASQGTSDSLAKAPPSPFTKSKRPTKKARRSVFEPISDVPQRIDLHFGVRKDSGVEILGGGKEAKKLNTVEKSAMDWAGFVDKEGIKDELDAAGKSKGAYRARQEFLARVENKREDEARKARGL